MRDLGSRLRGLRERAGSTQKEWGDLLGWDPCKVAKVEAGAQMPSFSDVQSMAKLAPVGTKEHLIEAYDLYTQTAAEVDKRRRSSPVIRNGVVQVEPDVERSKVVSEYRDNAESDVARLLQHARWRLLGYQGMRIGTLVFTAITPVLAALSAPPAATAAVGFLALTCTGIIQLTQLNGRAVVDQQQAAALSREVRLYKAGGQEYSEADADALLVRRVEEIRARGESARIQVIQQAFAATTEPCP